MSEAATELLSAGRRYDAPEGGACGPRSRVEAALAAMISRLATALSAIDVPEAEALAALELGPAAWATDGGVIGLPQGEPEPVDRLLQAVAAGPAERDLLALSLVCHYHAVVAAALRVLHPEGQPWVSLGLAAELADRGLLAGLGSREDLAATLADSELVRVGVLTVKGNGPLPERTLQPGPLVWEGLTGLAGWPPGVELDPLPAPDWGLERWLDTDVVVGACAAVGQSRPVALVLAGERPQVTAARLAVLVRRSGRTPVVLRTEQLVASTVSEILVLALLRDRVPVLCETGGRATEHHELVIPSLPVPLLVARRTAGMTTWPRPALFLPAAAMTAPDRAGAVRAALPELPVGEPVGSVTLEPRDLDLAAADLRARVDSSGPLSAGAARDLLLEGIDRRVAGMVPEGAAVRHPRSTWDDLVLPDERLEMLHEAVERCRIQQDLDQRLGNGREPAPGVRGLRLLFSGPPGTGKTLAAEVLAAALGRDLLVADLSRLVSKWIGETEKNLAAMFDAGERDDAVLFFDEADALFGKRTEVGDARDRYANLETAYLLSRLERFDGVVVLATNLRRNIDTAFARRIEFVVPFDPPDDAARLQLWQLHVPHWAELGDDVDLRELALRYDVPGALIRNAALAAAFLAEGDRRREQDPAGPPRISADHLVHAMRREHAKAGLAFPGPHRETRPSRSGRECP